MNWHNWSRLLYLIIFSALAACQAGGTASPANDEAGQIIFWRTRGDETNEATWQTILDRFEEENPHISVIQSVYAEEEFRQRYELATDIGVGPDLFIADNSWITDLAGRGLIRPVEEDQLNLEIFLSGAVESLRYEGALFGLPLALNNNALYYNPTLVERPAATLDELLQHAQEGSLVTITSTFDEAFWGIQAFGGRIFDQNQQVVLAEGGMANWLSWLRNAQDEPGVIVNADKLALRDLFTAGEAAYYVGAPDELAGLEEAMGADNVAVALLPSGPQGPAGPLHEVEAVLFGPNSSAGQAELAFLLARFMTNLEQETILLRETGRVPANNRVQVDNRIYPKASSFVVQARTALALPNIPLTDQLLSSGNEAYRTVLAGAASPADGVMALFTNLTGEEPLVVATGESVSAACGGAGELTLWHSLPDSAGRTLANIASDFRRNCPDINITLEQIERDELLNRLETAGENRPDMILATQNNLVDLVEAGQIVPVTGVIDEETQQRFVARAFNALRYENEIYGFPFALDVTTLYRNLQRAADAPVTLEDLLLLVNRENSLIFPVTGRDAFWGITAHSSIVFDEEGRFLPDPAGLIAWLTWLSTNQSRPGIITGDDQQELRGQFAAGDGGYFIGRAGDYSFLLDSLSSAVLRSSTLPAGPIGPGRPLLFVESFMVTTAGEENLEAVLAFINYATSSNVQEIFMTRERLVPANINVSTDNFPNVAVMQNQAQNAEVLPAGFPYAFAEEEANRMYARVLNEEATPAEAACAFIMAVNAEWGLELTPEDLGPSCPEEE